MFPLALTVAGLAVLGIGLTEAVPFVNFGTSEERESAERALRVVWTGTVVLAVAAIAMAASGYRAQAALVAAAGVAPAVLAAAAPDTALAWVAFVPLGLVALGATLTTMRD